MEAQKTILFYEKCRLCLEKPGSTIICDVQDLSKDIFLFTSVKVSPKDNLPQKICKECYEIVKKIKELKLLATKNDSALRSLLDDDSFDKSITNTTKKDINPTDFLEGVTIDDSGIKENCSQTETKNENHKRKHSTGKKDKKDDAKEDDNEKSSKSRLKVREDLFEASASQVSSSTTSNNNKDKKGTVTPKKRKSNEPQDDNDFFRCEVCSKVLETHKKLYMHMRQHNKNFACPLDGCEKKFATKNDLEKHKRTHTGEKPYSCDICDRSFAQLGSLRMHREAVHCLIIFQ